jgi:hypothetical protein
MIGPEDNPADDHEPTQEEWDDYEQGLINAAMFYSGHSDEELAEDGVIWD